MAAPPPDDPAKLGGLQTFERTPLVVESEKLVFHCGERDGSVRCHFRASYAVHNPTAAAVEQRAAFVGVRTPRVVITVDGRNAATSLTPEQAVQMRALVAGRDVPQEPQLFGLAFRIEAGQRVTIVAEGDALPGERGHRQRDVYALNSNYGRHLLLGQDDSDRPDRGYLFHYLIAPIHTWASVGPIDIEVHYDDSYALEGGLLLPTDYVPFTPAADDGDFAVARISTRGDAKATHLVIELVDEVVPIYHGGPVIGVGGVADEGSEFRMRFGWEFAAPQFVIWSVNADTDFRDIVVIAPVVEVATPHIFLIVPSLAFGVGAPFRILDKEVRAGVRLQGTVSWLPIGFVTSVDIFPGAADGDPHGIDVSLLGRLSM